MTVTPFSAGRFSSASPVVEWDGSNHQDILTWIHELDTYGLDQEWAISSVTATELTLTLPPTSLPPEQQPPAYPWGGGTSITLAVGDWLTASPIEPAYDGPPAWLLVQKVNKAGMWQTTDPYGRPLAVEDILAPGGTGPDPDPVLAPPTIAATVDSLRRALVTGQPGATGTAAAYQIHELRKYPDSTLKATVAPDVSGGFSRLSGTLQPFVLEYAARAVAADGTLSKFSNTVIVTITDTGGTVAPGQPAGWDTATPPDPDPGTDPTDPDDPGGPDPDPDPNTPPTTDPSVPWTRRFRDGTLYNPPTGGDGLTAGIVSTASALPTISSNATVTYTGPALTSLVTITGKPNVTLKGIRLAPGGKLVIKDSPNFILDDLDLTYEPTSDSQAGDLVAFRGTAQRVGVRNSVFGPATYTDNQAVTSTVQFLAVLDAVDHVYLDRVTFRNKSTPGNAFRIYGDYNSATGGCQYSVASQVLWDRAEPFRENDQEMARFGTSAMHQTDGHHIVEFSRIQNVATEPELLSFKMNWSTCRGNTFVDCVGSPVFRHGNDGEIHDCYMVGDRVATASGSTTQRTSSGFRGYGRGHKAHHLTIRVNGTGKYEAPFLIDEGDTSPDALSNGHANNVGWRVSNILLVKCGAPFVVGANYSTPPADCEIKDSWVVECADAGTTGLKVASGGSASGVALSNVQVFGTTAGAGLTQGGSGEWKAPATADRGCRTPFVTAAMAGKGATWDPWSGLSGGGDPGGPTTPPPTAPEAVYPMDLLPDYWKLTLPLWDPNNSSKVWEIIKDGSPDLDTFSNQYFRLNTAKNGVEMIATYDGAHTPNSTNVRSELREMTANGKSLASWSTNSGHHKMVSVLSIDRLDGNHVVAAQIHGGDDDVTVFRLEGSTLWLTDGDEPHGKAILTNYQLGTPIAVGFHVAGGNCDYYLQQLPDVAAAVGFDPNSLYVPGNKKHSLAVSDSSCYFKTGDYLQRKGSSGSWTQVTLFKTMIMHY